MVAGAQAPAQGEERVRGQAEEATICKKRRYRFRGWHRHLPQRGIVTSVSTVPLESDSTEGRACCTRPCPPGLRRAQAHQARRDQGCQSNIWRQDPPGCQDSLSSVQYQEKLMVGQWLLQSSTELPRPDSSDSSIKSRQNTSTDWLPFIVWLI